MSDPCKVWWEIGTDSKGRMILLVRKTAKKKIGVAGAWKTSGRVRGEKI